MDGELIRNSDLDTTGSAPRVSVCLITYNHAPYIRECIESLLDQQTAFSYEICIGEDESSDGTREICVEYAEKYPDKIRLILRSQSEPVRCSFRSQGVYNYIETSKACRGKYVAQCDGDDVWLDPLKLQKQYDTMESDPSISMVFSDFEIWYEMSGRRTGNRFERNQAPPRHDDIIQFRRDLVCMNYHIAASSVLMRTQDLLDIFDKNEAAFKTLPMGDTTTWCEMLEIGRFKYIDEPLVARRQLAESDSSSQSAERKFRFVNDASNLGIMLGKKYGLPMDVIRENKIKNCNRYALLSGDLTEISQLHSNAEYSFPVIEHLLYHAITLPVIGTVIRYLYELRYRLKNGRVTAP